MWHYGLHIVLQAACEVEPYKVLHSIGATMDSLFRFQTKKSNHPLAPKPKSETISPDIGIWG